MKLLLTLVASAASGIVVRGAPSAVDVLLPSKAGTSGGVTMQILLLLTALTFLPAAIMSMTPFLRITVVLHFLRQALGTQSTPSNQVLIGLALFLTILIMNPVATQIYDKAWRPMEAGQITAEQAMDEGSKPLRTFLLRSRENVTSSSSLRFRARSRHARPPISI